MTDGYHDRTVTVACGQCRGCRLEKSRQWAVRCLHENTMSSTSCFLTLTYEDSKLPPNNSLVLSHWQDFAKRLRHTRGPFRFFHCGEYGERTFRPHYHALVFGLDFDADKKLYTMTNGFPLYTSDELDSIWTHGFCQIGEVTFESAAYVARYVMKKQTGAFGKAMYGEAVDPETGEVHPPIKPPYTTMSRRPGIGKTWLDKYGLSDVYPFDEVIVNGQACRPPSFYDYVLEKEDPAALAAIKAKRIKLGRRHRANNTPERLAVREEIAERKTDLLPRKEF